jgi:hypothetical protein
MTHSTLLVALVVTCIGCQAHDDDSPPGATGGSGAAAADASLNTGTMSGGGAGATSGAQNPGGATGNSDAPASGASGAVPVEGSGGSPAVPSDMSGGGVGSADPEVGGGAPGAAGDAPGGAGPMPGGGGTPASDGNSAGGSAQGGATSSGGAPQPAQGGSVASGGAAAGGNSPTGDDGEMSFFVTSRGMEGGGNLGGLLGADAFCQELAEAVGFGHKTWVAYLSTSEVDARDRIGAGPWRNQQGVVIADNVEALHDQVAGGALDATWPPADLSIALDENGDEVQNEEHDILTGSLEDGTLASATCQDWTSDSADDVAQVGHSNRDGGGRPPSFSTTHEVGCAPGEQNYQSGTVTSGGGRGSLYCFAP